MEDKIFEVDSESLSFLIHVVNNKSLIFYDMLFGFVELFSSTSDRFPDTLLDPSFMHPEIFMHISLAKVIKGFWSAAWQIS